jgi:hypothetical protein
VIGGLLTSTLLSLLVIPVVFTFIDDLVRLFRRIGQWMHHFNHGSQTTSAAATMKT